MALISRILLAIYCMPLPTLTILVIIACVLFLKLRQLYGRKRWWRILMVAGLAVSFFLIALQTFWGRSAGTESAAPILTPFHTYRAYFAKPFEEILRMNFMNTILFLPAGLFLCALLPRRFPGWAKILLTVLLCGALSAGIEYCQYAYALGQAEIDDVLHNVFGTLLGALLSGLKILRVPSKHT